MLDIISVITLLFLLIILSMIFLLIIGGNSNKTEEEQIVEDDEEMRYIKEYREKQINKKLLKRKYNWKHIKAYSIIALNNLLHSANEVDLKNIDMFLDPLQTLYNKEQALKYAEKLLDKENK